MSRLQESPANSVHIALLGGGFDPITLGHENMAQITHQHMGYPVWIMPCYQHLYGKELASPIHRLDMVKLVTDQYKWATAIDFEIRNKTSGSMYETLKLLKIQNPTITFHVVIGTDNADTISSWDQADNLIAENPFIVLLRPDYPPKKDWYQSKPHTFIKQELVTSSTAVRAAIENNKPEDAKKDLNPLVWDYIVAKKLYGYGG